jgi:hypothetical protein
MDKEIAHTIGAVTIAIINALNDEGYNAAVETLHRYASDETRSEKQRSLFGSLVHVLTTPLEQQARESEEYDRKHNFTVITGGAA